MAFILSLPPVIATPGEPTSQPTHAAREIFVNTYVGLQSSLMKSRGDGLIAQAGMLVQPSDVEVDPQGNIYIAENKYIRKVSKLTGVI
ncbi:hypothetical protein EON63_25195, partial [archaeon]